MYAFNSSRQWSSLSQAWGSTDRSLPWGDGGTGGSDRPGELDFPFFLPFFFFLLALDEPASSVGASSSASTPASMHCGPRSDPQGNLSSNHAGRDSFRKAIRSLPGLIRPESLKLTATKTDEWIWSGIDKG